ncbi:hypothetical protein HDV00_003270 [Rhizophlyctis rosea]|nr:hypothetical protein HDV00_003270 [Rhizophlyctis rosea]
MFKATLLLGLLSAFSGVLALPNGAPISEQAISGGHGKPSDPTVGYSLTVTPSTATKNAFDIKVANSAGRTSFNGILIYVQADNDDTKHLGKWINLDTTNYHFQTAMCTSSNVSGDAESTFTHSNPSDKSLDSTTFTWQPLDSDLAVTGPVKVHAVFATSPNPWQVVDAVEIPLKGASGGNSSATGVATTPVATTPAGTDTAGTYATPTDTSGGDVTTSTMTITVDAPTSTAAGTETTMIYSTPDIAPTPMIPTATKKKCTKAATPAPSTTDSGTGTTPTADSGTGTTPTSDSGTGTTPTTNSGSGTTPTTTGGGYTKGRGKGHKGGYNRGSRRGGQRGSSGYSKGDGAYSKSSKSAGLSIHIGI